CATAGIPHAAWIADALDLPMVYVRSKPKGHGKGNQIEGQILEGQKVVVIEDLISTGGSSLETAQVLQQGGADVLSVLAIFTCALPKAQQTFEEADIPFTTITGFDDLLEALKDKEDITEAEHQELLSWRNHL